jgi:hypothetical protein
MARCSAELRKKTPLPSTLALEIQDLELPPIGWQLFILENSQSDSTAFPSSLDTYATRLLAEPPIVHGAWQMR